MLHHSLIFLLTLLYVKGNGGPSKQIKQKQQEGYYYALPLDLSLENVDICAAQIRRYVFSHVLPFKLFT